MKRLQLFFLIVILLLAGCQGNFIFNAVPVSADTQIEQPVIEMPSVQSEEANDSTNSSGLSMLVPLDSGIEGINDKQKSDVMELTFPTPVAEPVSLWRPPLYDTPWALTQFDHFYFVRPIAADQVNWPIADYRYGGIIFENSVHTGIDIPAKRGTTVIAAGNGKVNWAGYGLSYGTVSTDDPYGLAVSIEHDFGYKGNKLYTIYAHLDRIDVQVGQTVDTGTSLGIVGLTGNTTGPHLHFEIRVEEDSYYTTRNPELWIAPPQGWGVLSGDFRNTNESFLDHQLVIIRSLDINQSWSVYTYGPNTVHKDDYYQENMVIGDLPAGDYRVGVDYQDETYTCDVQIFPGAVTYIKFVGENGCTLSKPVSDGVQNWPDQE